MLKGKGSKINLIYYFFIFFIFLFFYFFFVIVERHVLDPVVQVVFENEVGSYFFLCAIAEVSCLMCSELVMLDLDFDTS